MFKVDRKSLDVENMEKVNFSEVGWTEPKEVEKIVSSNLEKFIKSKNEQENLMIVGRQVRDRSSGRNDVVALDGRGNMVIVEVKRDRRDSKARRENIESQAIRYASALANIDSPTDLLNKMYESYFSKYVKESIVEDSDKLAREKLYGFLDENEVPYEEEGINKKQRIVLFASGYSERALSSLAWLSKNGVNITVLRGSLFKHKEQLFLDVRQVLPTTEEEEYFVGIEEQSSSSSHPTSASRTRKPRVADLIEEGLISEGDELRIPTESDKPDPVGTLVDGNHVEVEGEKRSTNQWAKEVRGWDSVSIYREVEHVGRNQKLNEIREELE